jgi:hypothetical protein
MSDDDRILEALPAGPPPPPDLADRVLAEAHGGRARRWPVADAAGIVALGAALLLVHGGHRSWEGRVAVTARATIAIAGRATAVAEAGAELSWRVDGDGAARVAQRAGRVFYRVEPGGPFVVATDAGDVRVTGTCFAVEVDDMKTTKQLWAGGAAGAALATVVIVSVYEGRVILANPRGQVAVEAGQRGRAQEGGAPAREAAPAPVAPARGTEVTGPGAAGAAAGAVAPGEVVSLRSRVEQLEKQLVHTREQLAEAAHAAGQVMRVSPSAEDLKAWAQKCEIHIDAPSVWGSTPDALTPERVEDWGLTAAEVPLVDQAQAEQHARALAQFKQIYLLATGDAAGAEQLTPGAMYGEIMDKADAAAIAQARRLMSQERAGLAAPPADLSKRPPAEQALRLVASMGGEFESLVAAQLGPTRARELRERYNGWPGLRMDTDGCPK